MARFYELKIDMDEIEDGTPNWLVTAPAFPEITTFAEEKPEACVQGLHAIEEAIAGRIADVMDVPAPMKTTPARGISSSSRR
jgi:antitoxin HicB